MLHVLQVECLVPEESEHTSRCAHHDVRAVALQGLLVLFYAYPAKKYGGFYVVEILTETLVFLVYLER